MNRKLIPVALAPFLVLANGCLVFMDLDLTRDKTPFQEVILEESGSWWTDEKVALVDVHGILAKRYGSSSFFSSPLSPDPVADLKEALRRAAGDSDVRAVVLRIDSPGGVVSWCDAMYQEIATFKKETKKPVVACITGLGASGGYYIALAADTICAAPAAAVGSIGVIAVFLNLEELAGKIGVETQVIKSGDKKDMGGLWRHLEPDEKKIVQSMIDEYYGRFVDLVLKNRPGLTRKKLATLADGRLFTAQQAQKSGLVDELAYLDQAIGLAKKAAKLKDAALVTYARSYQYVNNIYSQTPHLNLINVDLHSVTGALPAGFYFLWQSSR